MSSSPYSTRWAVRVSRGVDNRLTGTSATTDRYEYNAANQRVQVAVGTTSWTQFYFYGLNGELLSSSVNPWPGTGLAYHVYFAGMKIRGGQGNVMMDRLEPVTRQGYIGSGAQSRFYPYGEQASGTALSGQTAYGTYWREAGTGLDYAMNRYYLSRAGRFTTADPYQASAGPALPGFWSRYAYVEGDPVKFNDPVGLQLQMVTWWGCYCTGPSDDRRCSGAWGMFTVNSEAPRGALSYLPAGFDGPGGGAGSTAFPALTPAFQAQASVLNGKANDCEAMGSFLSQISLLNGTEGGSAGLAQLMRPVTVHTKWNPAGVSGTSNFVMMNVRNSFQSGFAEKYRESAADDQGHHFASFSQLGLLTIFDLGLQPVEFFRYAIAASRVGELWQTVVGGNVNMADCGLGLEVIYFGAQVSSGRIKAGNIRCEFVSRFCDSARLTGQ